VGGVLGGLGRGVIRLAEYSQDLDHVEGGGGGVGGGWGRVGVAFLKKKKKAKNMGVR